MAWSSRSVTMFVACSMVTLQAEPATRRAPGVNYGPWHTPNRLWLRLMLKKMTYDEAIRRKCCRFLTDLPRFGRFGIPPPALAILSGPVAYTLGYKRSRKSAQNLSKLVEICQI